MYIQFYNHYQLSFPFFSHMTTHTLRTPFTFRHHFLLCSCLL